MVLFRSDIVDLLQEIVGEQNAFDILESTLADINRQTLSNSLLECGIIPELFPPSSSEEKLWAKYCDILLSHAWTHLGIPSDVLRTRGDSADVFGKTRNYTIVGDAKAFRLSRTAKNQKDFKISALNDWRKSNTYACLTSPLFQYPNRTSQIYSQAIQRNVTLLSYTHLRFLVDNFSGQDLIPLWQIADNLPTSKDAIAYWQAVDNVVIRVVEQTESALQKYKAQTVAKTKALGAEGIHYWQVKIEKYKSLSQQEAVERLIKAEKIEAKIETIHKAMDIRV